MNKAQRKALAAQALQSTALVTLNTEHVNVDVVLNTEHVDAVLNTEHVDATPVQHDASEIAALVPSVTPAPRIDAGKRANNISAKQWLIDLLSVADASYTLVALCALSAKSEVNIRTMLSDLRSTRYCGKYGVFATKSTRIAGVTYYSKAH